MADHKLDIFDVLSAIDRHDYDYLSEQDPDRRKAFAPPVVLRWASAVRGEAGDYLLMLTNARANLDFFELSDHPDLQYRLMASCGLGIRARHEWIAMPARARPTSALHGFLATYWPEANSSEIDLLAKGFTRETFVAFVHGCGLSPADESTAMDGYDRFHGIKVKAKKAGSGGGKKKAKR